MTSESPKPDPVARVLMFRRWRWWVLLLYIVSLPFALAYLSSALFLSIVPITAVVGTVLFVRLGRHRLAAEYFEGLEIFQTAIAALSQTFGTHLYLRERYSRDGGKHAPIKIKMRKSYAGIRGVQPFLVVKASGHRLFLTPRRYWLQTHGKIISGPTSAIELETFDIEEKVDRPRDDDEVLSSTWLYATKRGDRDLRFTDNQELWLVRRHAIELSIEKYRWAICLYGLANARTFVSSFAEIAPQPIELEYHQEGKDEEEFVFEESPPQPIEQRWFEVLGVPAQATIGEIKTAYRTLIQQYHPDRVAHLGEKLRRVANDEAGVLNRAYKEGISARGQG